MNKERIIEEQLNIIDKSKRSARTATEEALWKAHEHGMLWVLKALGHDCNYNYEKGEYTVRLSSSK